MAAGWISDAPSGPGLEFPWGGGSSSTPREEVFPGEVMACFRSGLQARGQPAPAVTSPVANWLQPLSAMLGRTMRAGWAAGHAVALAGGEGSHAEGAGRGGAGELCAYGSAGDAGQGR